jgi:hypothetical protein
MLRTHRFIQDDSSMWLFMLSATISVMFSSFESLWHDCRLWGEVKWKEVSLCDSGRDLVPQALHHALSWSVDEIDSTAGKGQVEPYFIWLTDSHQSWHFLGSWSLSERWATERQTVFFLRVFPRREKRVEGAKLVQADTGWSKLTTLKTQLLPTPFSNSHNSFKMIDTADPELERSQIRSKIQCHRSIRARVLSCYKAVKHQPVSLSSIQLNQALHSPELLCGLAN